jgi:hypothetical protein
MQSVPRSSIPRCLQCIQRQRIHYWYWQHLTAPPVYASFTNEYGRHDLSVTSLVHYVSKSDTELYCVVGPVTLSGPVAGCGYLPQAKTHWMSKQKTASYWSELRKTNRKYFMLIILVNTNTLLLLLLLLLFVLSSMLGIYNHIPETKHVCTAIPTAHTAALSALCAMLLVKAVVRTESTECFPGKNSQFVHLSHLYTQTPALIFLSDSFCVTFCPLMLPHLPTCMFSLFRF